MRSRLNWARAKTRLVDDPQHPRGIRVQIENKRELAKKVAAEVKAYVMCGGEIDAIPYVEAPKGRGMMSNRELDIAEASKRNGLADMRDKYGRFVLIDLWSAKGCSYIYFIQSGENGPVKIGRSANPCRRIQDLKRYQSDELRFLGVFFGPSVMESVMHHVLSKDRLEGEWFRPSEDVLAMAEVTYHIYRKGLQINSLDSIREWLG